MDDELKQFEEDLAEASRMAGDWFIEETRKFVFENHTYNSREDKLKAHTKTLDGYIAEILYNKGYRKVKGE